MPISVVVVDDTRVIRNSIKDFFDKDFFNIVGEACDGFEAVKAYKEYRPDIVTMDMNMPGCDGVEAIKMIRKEDPDAYIIIISSMDDDIIKGLEAGAKACVFKPISLAKFREVMRQVFIDIENKREEASQEGQNNETYKGREVCKKTNESCQLRTNSKYGGGLKAGLQLKDWNKEIIYKFFWQNDRMILEIRKDPAERGFNRLVNRIKSIKADGVELEIVCEKNLDENMKIQFLKMLLL